MTLPIDGRPIVAVAGPNGAGKSTFYHSHLRPVGLQFVNADVLARNLSFDPYAAAKVADALRRELLKQRQSFVFETVFSDPGGDKLSFLKEAIQTGYTVVLIFIGISDPNVSETRVAMRVSQGGHDVPSAKLVARFPRTLKNLRSAIRELPNVLIFDNDDLHMPYRQVAVYSQGKQVLLKKPVPLWLKPLL